jgi:hypothetical protein
LVVAFAAVNDAAGFAGAEYLGGHQLFHLFTEERCQMLPKLAQVVLQRRIVLLLVGAGKVHGELAAVDGQHVLFEIIEGLAGLAGALCVGFPAGVPVEPVWDDPDLLRGGFRFALNFA